MLSGVGEQTEQDAVLKKKRCLKTKKKKILQ